ncbi:MAG TPA: hypothetical protein VL652_12335, partial [Kutzneria sp.]|nr:hypothetical protein [Kutzneria sp.]
DDEVRHAIHAQCPLRVVHGDVILLGSHDVHQPKVRGADKDEAFDNFATMYDAQASSLTSWFKRHEFRVVGSDLETAGLLAIEATDGSDVIRLEIIPMTSGPKVESWRLFRVGDSVHHVFPEAAGKD